MISFVFHAQLLLVVAVAPGSILSILLERGESLVSKYLDSILVKEEEEILWRADSIPEYKENLSLVIPLVRHGALSSHLNKFSYILLMIESTRRPSFKKERENLLRHIYNRKRVRLSVVTILRFAQLHPVFHFPPTNKERGLLPSLFTFSFSFLNKFNLIL